jgi:hypothetical protein
MAEFKLPPFAAPCKTHDLPPIYIGPRLQLHLCEELLAMALAHENLSRELQSIETRFSALLALVKGAAR